MKQPTNTNLYEVVSQLADDLILAFLVQILSTLDFCLSLLAWAWRIGQGRK